MIDMGDNGFRDFVLSFPSTSTTNSSYLNLSDAMCAFNINLYTTVSIEQFVQEVVDFSSQYGGDYSISYTALNIIGRPSKYPDYGDFPETFAMRSYGNWWEQAPSRSTEIMPQNRLGIPADDFIILQFEQIVIPDKIHIFETYNPGAIVRIWAFTVTEKWICLWEGSPQVNVPNNSRIFSPTLRKIATPTSILRLEFNHSALKYFTEIDAVMLVGKKCDYQKSNNIFSINECLEKKGPIQRTLENIKFTPCNGNNRDCLRNFIVNDLNKFVQKSLMLSSEDFVQNVKPSLEELPFEILFKIFSYLDLISLFRIGCVSRLMYEVSTDPLLYSDINLQPYWNLSTSSLLCALAKRSTLLKKIDLSWCGLYGSISRTEFKKFIQQTGDNLTHLRLNSCKFLNASCLDTIGIVCDNLKELSLRNYADPPIWNFSCLENLKNLERLDLFRTVIEPNLLRIILENNPKLKHLNLAFGGIGINMDEIAIQISNTNKNLISVDLWKSHSLTSVGLQAFSNCQNLEEVDFGWCLREEASPGESLKCLLTSCTKLKKLFLAAIRGITDRDVDNISHLCPNLEQLDLMGVLGISTEQCYRILLNCNKLKLLDLSFCENIDEHQIKLWREQFSVCIKRSFVPSDFLG